MPNFGIGSVAVRISQTGTQEALIQNTGNSTLYLDQYSSVSSANHGLALAPLSSVNWAAGRELWAVCAPGTDTSVTVLYGATGTALSEIAAVVTGDVTATIDGPVNANITNASIPVTGDVEATITNASIPVTGDVNANITNGVIDVSGTVDANITNAVIDATVTGNIIVDSGEVNVGGILTPVTIEGGGALVHSQSGNLTPGQVLNINVPLPVSGRTFYAFKITVEITSPQHATLPRVIGYTDTFDNFTTIVRYPTADQGVSIPYKHSFTIPAQQSTFTILLRNPSGTLTNGYSVRVDGVNVGSPYPATNIGYLLNSCSPVQVTPPTSGATVNVWLPPSFQEYKVLMRTASTAAVVVGMTLNYINDAGTLEQYAGRAYSTGVNTTNINPTNNNFEGAGNVYIPISGNGRSAQIAFPPNVNNSQMVFLALV